MFLWAVVAAPVPPYFRGNGRFVVPASHEHVGTAVGKDVVETLEKGAFLRTIRTTVARPDNLNGTVGSRFRACHVDEVRNFRGAQSVV